MRTFALHCARLFVVLALFGTSPANARGMWVGAGSSVGPNSICLEAHVLEFAVLEGIKAMPVNADYCELPPASVPSEVRDVLSRIQRIHVRYAEAVGIAPRNLYGFGVRIRMGAHPIGPLASITGDEVEIDVFPDFHGSLFPDRIYAHELTHRLLLDGKLGQAAANLEPRYLFSESFPDLVSSYVTGSRVIDFADRSVLPVLTLGRGGEGLQSMSRPFRDFYLETAQAEGVNACSGIPPAAMSANERSMCAFFKVQALERAKEPSLYEGSKDRAPSKGELKENFHPEWCLIRYEDGTSGLDACDQNALGPVLISFIHSIDTALGEKPLVGLLAAINASARERDQYVCEFTSNLAQIQIPPLVPATTSFSSVMRVFKTIRDNLLTADRRNFDRSWADHGLGSWETLERFDHETVVADAAYQKLVRANPEFAEANTCTSEIPTERGPNCAAKCTFVPSKN